MGKVYSKPVFGHSYVLINIAILFKLDILTHSWPIQSKGLPELGYSPLCMNEGNPHFTFQTIYMSMVIF